MKLTIYWPVSVKLRVEVFELDTGVLGCELPVGLGVIAVLVRLPSDDFVDEHLLIGNTAVETLRGEDAQFGLSQVEPTAVLRGIVPLEAFDEARRLGKPGRARL